MTYVVTFISKTGHDDNNVRFDVEAKDSKEAFKTAYELCRDKCNGEDPYVYYSDAMTYEKPKGIANIGIRFRYHDGKNCYDNYMVIRAGSEAKAVEYYNTYYRGKRFHQPWPARINETGNCVYGEVAETYFAACPGYDADATEGGVKT